MPDNLTTQNNSNIQINFDSVFNDEIKVEVKNCSVQDALIHSLNNRGRVDISYISELSKKTIAEVIKLLEGTIYLDPKKWDGHFPLKYGWVTKEEYLSGNVYDKYKTAFIYNKQHCGLFNKNVEALQAVLPKNVDPKDIYVTLGTPWLPNTIVEDFIHYLLNYRERVNHDDITGSWHFENRYGGDYISNYRTYGTKRINAINIIEKTLNLQPIKVTDNHGTKEKPIYITNEKETNLALEKQSLILKKFQEWVWQDVARARLLRSIFYEKYCSSRKREYDGSFLTFPDLNKDISLYPYQKNAVARILFSKNTFLAHDVGSGKTYEMIAAGHELKRMGLSKKNLYVVPNNIVDQWANIYKMMYPNDHVLVVTNKNFKPDKREETLRKMKDEDYDGIIIDYASFSLIPLSPSFYIQKFHDLKSSLSSISYRNRTPTVNRKLSYMNRKEAEYIDKLQREQEEAIGKIFFEDLNIDRLFVDEAHNFKNVPFFSKNTMLLGLNQSGSDICEEMMDKVHLIQSHHNGGGIIFASGTPITNSIADAYILQKYLQDAELSFANVSSFDAWAQNFAELTTEFEIDPTANSFRMATRLARFHNVPELANLMGNVVDFYHLESNAALPSFNGYKDVIIPKSKDLKEYLQFISSRADLIKKKKPLTFKNGDEEIKDNMLLITTDGRKAALDLRIIDEDKYYRTYDSKVYKCAENAYKIYRQYNDIKATQIIFSDISTPKTSFNVYDEVKDILVRLGVPSEEIAFIQSANTDRERNKIFKKFNDGEIRILMGSTFKLGTGVNVQNKLIAIHHLDVPWRPSDMVQREGRIIRPGNSNEEVFIYRYITEHSFDAYSWQLLEMKQKFISKLLNSDVNTRSIDDIDSTVLNYAEVKALAIGDPLIKQRIETYNEIQRLKGLRVKFYEQKEQLKNDIIHKKKEKDILEDEQTCMEVDLRAIKTLPKCKLSKEEKIAYGEEILKAVFISNNENKETSDIKYRDYFTVITVPFVDDKRFIYLESPYFRYRIEIADSALGVTTRLDNFVNDFAKHLADLNKSINDCDKFINSALKELMKKDTYASKIKELENKLEDLDILLGVNKNETTH